MGFKNFYVTLNESEEDYAHQTELGKKLGLEHKGKGVYENRGGDKYFYNKNSGTFKGWKGSLDPNNPEHHVKPTENLEAKKEMLEKDIDEKKPHEMSYKEYFHHESKKYAKENNVAQEDMDEIYGKDGEDHGAQVYKNKHLEHVKTAISNGDKISEKSIEHLPPDSVHMLVKNNRNYFDTHFPHITGDYFTKSKEEQEKARKVFEPKEPEKEADLSKNKDGSDFEEFHENRFKKPEKVHERFQVHGHEFVVHSSRRNGESAYDKVSVSHESGMPILGGAFKKQDMERNVGKVKGSLNDARDPQDLNEHLKRVYQNLSHEYGIYPNAKNFENVHDYLNAKKFHEPTAQRFEKYFGDDLKKSQDKNYNSKQEGFNEKIGDRTYVDHSHFTPRGGMSGSGAVDRHNKTGREVLFDDKEEKYYLGDKVVAPYDHEAFQKNPKEQVRYKTLGGETKNTAGGHTEPFEQPKTPEDKHFSEVKKQQIEMAHNVIRGAYEKMDENEKKRAIEKLGSGKFHEENMTSEHGKRFNKAGSYLGELSRSGLKQIHAELSGVPLEKKKTGKFKHVVRDNGEDRDNKQKKIEVKYLDELEHEGHKFVIHKSTRLFDGKMSTINQLVLSHKETGLSSGIYIDKNDNNDSIKKKLDESISKNGKKAFDDNIEKWKKVNFEDFKE